MTKSILKSLAAAIFVMLIVYIGSVIFNLIAGAPGGWAFTNIWEPLAEGYFIMAVAGMFTLGCALLLEQYKDKFKIKKISNNQKSFISASIIGLAMYCFMGFGGSLLSPYVGFMSFQSALVIGVSLVCGLLMYTISYYILKKYEDMLIPALIIMVILMPLTITFLAFYL